MVPDLMGAGQRRVIAPSMPLSDADRDKEILIRDRNRIVSDIAAAHHLAVDDLYGLMIGKGDVQSEDGVHYRPEGQRIMAAQVTEVIVASLLS